MRITTKKAVKAILLAVIVTSLTACSEKSTTLVKDPTPVASPTPGAIKDITITKVTESEPGSSVKNTKNTPYEELPDQVQTKMDSNPTPTSTSKPSKAERVDTKFSGELPSAFTPPTSGKFTKQGSVIDGNRSFLGYSFTQDWQAVATSIKESMKNDGWECIMCQDLVAEDNKDEEVKYIMEMKNGSRKVYIAISVYNGKTSAGFNFKP